MGCCQARGELMRDVAAAIGTMAPVLGDSPERLPASHAAFAPASRLALQPAQAPVFLPCRNGKCDDLTERGRDGLGHAKVQADTRFAGVGHREIGLHAKAYIPMGSNPRNRQVPDRAADGPRQSKAGPSELRKPHPVPVDRKLLRVREAQGVSGALAPVPWKAAPTLEERLKGAVQVAQGRLEGVVRGLGEPGELFL